MIQSIDTIASDKLELKRIVKLVRRIRSTASATSFFETDEQQLIDSLKHIQGLINEALNNE